MVSDYNKTIPRVQSTHFHPSSLDSHATTPHVHYIFFLSIPSYRAFVGPMLLRDRISRRRAGVTESESDNNKPRRPRRDQTDQSSSDQVFNSEDCIPAAIVEQVCSSGHCVSHLCHVISHLPAVHSELVGNHVYNM